jgi:putative ATPase
MPLEPLASALRPVTLDGLCGQAHLVGAGKPLRTFMEGGNIPSMLFWGPPGCGKTTVASIISKTLKADFHRLSGVTSRKEDLVKILSAAKKNFSEGKPTVIFLDEIHRWNKAQQDVLLPFVEKGVVTLIGATTENPSFSVNSALLSRCRTFKFEPVSAADVAGFIAANWEKVSKAYPGRTLAEGAAHTFGELANGDVRNGLNFLEAALMLKSSGEITPQDALTAASKPLRYDRDGDEHYDTISAVHKSLRDSDPDAGLYWVFRMLEGGEDPMYVVRRLVRFASEDVGLADPFAQVLASSVMDTVKNLGMPECSTAIAQLTLYLAKAPKSNLAEVAAMQAAADARDHGNLEVPLHIRNAPTKLMKEFGYGKGYRYAHDLPDAQVDQEHFPDELKGRKYGEGSSWPSFLPDWRDKGFPGQR